MAAPPTEGPVNAPSSARKRGFASPLWSVWFFFLFLSPLVFVQPGRADPSREPTGIAWWLLPIEINAKTRLPMIDGDLNGVATTLDGKNVWVVGARGFMLASNDGGEHWERIPWPTEFAGPAPDILSVALGGPDRPFIGVPAEGTLWRQNGNWAKGPSWNTDGILPIFADSERAITIHLQRGDHPSFPAHAIAYSRPRAVMVGSKGETAVVAARDPKRRFEEQDDKRNLPLWSSHRSGVADHLRSVWLSPEGARAVACGDSGTIIVSVNNGIDWTRSGWKRPDAVYASPSPTLRSIAFDQGGEFGLIVGDGGTILSTKNGGGDWSDVGVRHDVDLRSVAMTRAGDLAWAVGPSGTLLRFDLRDAAKGPDAIKAAIADGFAHRFSRTSADLDAGASYLKLPSPLACVMVLMLLLPLVRFARRLPPIITRTESVAALLVTDRPVQPGEPAYGNLYETAEGVVRFLAHERTQPPLVLAVTGEWGSGKSSLMNLIRGRLQQVYSFPTVWFNAWHHQTEEHLAAALMKSLAKAIPPFWTPTGVMFRLRLLQGRGKWRIVVIALVLLLAGIAIGDMLVGQAHLVLTLADAAGSLASAKKLAVFGLSIGTLVAVVPAILHGLATFHLGGWFRTWFAGAFSIAEVKERIGFRQRFGDRFREVVTALRPQKLAIFIDDLDRCEPERVTRFLEVVNFLCTHGGCYVTIGTDLKYIRAAVGLGYRTIAAELETPAGDDPNKRPQDLRQKFARSYLDKLINIEVPVPQTDTRSAGDIIRAAARLETGPRVPTPLALLRATRRFAAAAGVPIMFLLMVIVGFLVAPSLERNVSVKPNLAQSRPVTKAGEPSEGAASSRVAETQSRPALPDQNEISASTRDVNYDSGLGAHVAGWVYGVPVVLLAGMILVFLRRRPRRLETDSANFESAINSFVPCVHEQARTPRSIKRFVNHARFVAMRQRVGEAPKPSPLRRLLIRMKLAMPVESAPAAPKSLDEEMIVALAAVEHTEPEALLQGEAGIASSALGTSCPVAIRSMKIDNATIAQYLALSRGMRFGQTRATPGGGAEPERPDGRA